MIWKAAVALFGALSILPIGARALAPTEIDDLLAGRGAGMAMSAELHGYPGPAHVLELADQLALSAEQRRATQALFDDMARDAKRLGAAIVAAERNLDRGFAERQIDAQRLRAMLSNLAGLRAELRYVHLRAHLAQTTLLSPAQIARYGTLRGHSPPPAHGGHKH
jgi:Spy/CpxP family protein refolding chaperone